MNFIDFESFKDNQNIFYINNGTNYTYQNLYESVLLISSHFKSLKLDNKKILLKITDPYLYFCSILALNSIDSFVILSHIDRPNNEIEQIIDFNYEISEINIDDKIKTLKKITLNFERDFISVFTSGSSSTPKAIVFKMSVLLYSAQGTNEFYNIPKYNTWALTLPIHHIGGLIIFFRQLLNTGSILNTSYKNIEDLKFDYISLVPAQIKYFFDKTEVIKKLKNIKLLLLGGQKPSKDTINFLNENKIPYSLTYGLTECASQACATKLGGDFNSKLSTLPYRKVEILNGKIMISGKCIGSGYYQNNNYFPFEGRVITNDIAKIESDGIKLLGRADKVFQSGGENINPEYIESIIIQNKNVIEAIVIPYPHDKFGNIPIAFIKMNHFDEKEILNFLNTKLEKITIPKRVYDLSKIKKIGIKYSKDQLINFVKNNE